MDSNWMTKISRFAPVVLSTPLLDLHWHRQETFEPHHIRQVSSEGPILVDEGALHGSKDKDKAQQEAGTQQ